MGFGSLAAGSMLADEQRIQVQPARAKNVIWVFSIWWR